MKKIISTIMLSSLVYCSFAQKTFKQLNFHKANSTVLKFTLMGTELVSNLAGSKNGTININTRDSSLTITASGDADKVYKIKRVKDKVTDQYDNKTVTIICTDMEGKPCTATIEKKYAYRSDNEMLFYITYPDGTGKGYWCTLLDNLLQN